MRRALLVIIVCIGPHLGLSAAGASGESPVRQPIAEPIPAYDELFHRETGWTGADADISVALGDAQTLWLYGDTFYGDIVDDKRCLCLVSNSIALQQGTDPTTATVDFHYGPRQDGVPTPFFTPPDGAGWFWPRHGIRVGDKVHLFLTQLVKDPSDPQFIFGKRIASWKVTIPNPSDPPAQWRLSYQKLPWSDLSAAGEDRLSLGQSIVQSPDGNIYVYGTKKVGTIHHQVVARAPADSLADLSKWRFYADGLWTDNHQDASLELEVRGPNYSVSYHPGLRSFLFIQEDLRPEHLAENGNPKQIVLRRAQGPTGPWTAPQVVYACPEPEEDAGRYCYHARGNPHLAEVGNELILSYASSNSEVGAINDADVYFPRFVRLRL